MRRHTVFALVGVVLVAATTLAARQAGSGALHAGARVFIAPIENRFDEHLRTAIDKKRVPVVLVTDRSQAEFEITGHSVTHRERGAREWLLGKVRSDEQASIRVASLESGDVVFAYSVNKGNSAHGARSAAEACAKHLGQEIEKQSQ